MKKRVGSLLTLAGPVYLELMAGVVAGFVDTLWVSRLGGDAVAAVTLATGLENVAYGIILIVSTGMTVRLATRIGQADWQSASQTLWSGFALGLLASLLVGAGGFGSRAWLAGLFGHGSGPGVLVHAAAYLAVTFAGIGGLYGQNVVNAAFKAQKDTRTPMFAAVLANVLNLLLDPLLIYGLAGFPRLGVAGAALATVAGRLIALVVSGALLARTPLVRHAHVTLREGVQPTTAAEIMRLGWPSALEFLVRMLGGMVMIRLIAGFGTAALAAYGLGYKLLLFVTMGFYSIRQAATIYTARQLGESGAGELPAIGRAAVLCGLGVAGFASVVLVLLSPILVAVFQPDGTVAATAISFLRFMAGYVVALSLVISLTGAFIGAGRSEGLFHVTWVGMGLQVVLAAAAGRMLGLPGIWLSMIASNVLQAAALTLLFGAVSARLVGRPAPGMVN